METSFSVVKAMLGLITNLPSQYLLVLMSSIDHAPRRNLEIHPRRTRFMARLAFYRCREEVFGSQNMGSVPILIGDSKRTGQWPHGQVPLLTLNKYIVGSFEIPPTASFAFDARIAFLSMAGLPDKDP